MEEELAEIVSDTLEARSVQVCVRVRVRVRVCARACVFK